MVDNTLNIDHFSGRMPFLKRSEIATEGAVDWAASLLGNLIGFATSEEYAGELTATGKADFSSFFEPRFDVDINGREVYYRSTDGTVEAIVDAQLKFSGRDTLQLSGDVPVLQAGYFDDFSTETEYRESIGEKGLGSFRYSLNTTCIRRVDR